MSVKDRLYWPYRDSAAESFERIRRGENPWIALRDFLNDWRWSDSEERLEIVAQALEQGSTSEEQRWAALFAAAIEHICTSEGFAVPAWTMESRYYLQEPWYPTAREGKLRHLVEKTTPEILKRRKVFAGDNFLLSFYEPPEW